MAALKSKFSAGAQLAPPKKLVQNALGAAKGTTGGGLQTIAANGGVTPGAPSPMPINPQFGADVNAAQLNLDTTLQGNQALRGQLGSQYGLGVDASGNVFDDKSNPWSKAAALQTAHDNAVRGTNTSYAARGQLYAGSRINAQNYNEEQTLRGRDALVREFMAANTGLKNSDLAATNAYNSAYSNAQAANTQYALEHPPDVAATAGAVAPLQDTNASAAPYKTVPGKDSKGNPGVWHIYPGANGKRVFVRG